ncbi:UTP--glucose-1-phosphate uridylyltransferase [Paenibacillus sp. PL2-23]|uniref:UTP--glucose-1-phosphate uridylyltransferase n=1 Tax=Paenibacillus sp. PL2-23 TaxID=2100729 RepID=UPI0030FA1DE7
MKLRKAVIPAAGLGTRFLPATKAMPKEMLPILDKPSIQLIVEEALSAGLDQICIITNQRKYNIEAHFTQSTELEQHLERKGDLARLELVRNLSKMASIEFVSQDKPLGLANAIECAKDFVGTEPFAVLLSDEITSTHNPCLKSMVNVYNKMKSPVLGVQQVPQKDTVKYGIVYPGKSVEQGVYEISDFVEKPPHAQSNLASIGRYILPASFFDYVKTINLSLRGEYEIADVLKKIMNDGSIYAYLYDGQRFDIGSKTGYLLANLHLAMEDRELREAVEMSKLISSY